MRSDAFSGRPKEDGLTQEEALSPPSGSSFSSISSPHSHFKVKPVSSDAVETKKQRFQVVLRFAVVVLWASNLCFSLCLCRPLNFVVHSPSFVFHRFHCECLLSTATGHIDARSCWWSRNS